MFLFSCSTNIPPLDPTGCNIVLNVTDTKQYIATERYPVELKTNQKCYYYFEAPPGRNIILFFEYFKIGKVNDFVLLRK